MNQVSRASLTVLALCVSVFSQQAADPSGHWEGVIKAPNRDVQISVDLAKNDKQAWIGHLSFIGPGPKEVPLDAITVAGASINFNVIGIPGGMKFETKLDPATKALTGTVTGGSGSVDVEFKRTGEAKVVVPVPSSPLSKELEGKWEGTVEMMGKSYRLVLNLKTGADGRGTGTLVSLDQNAVEIPLGTITQAGDKLDFEIKMIAGKYSGTINAAKNEIAGEWSQAGRTAPLVY
jgi:hypothetical protein